jgi:hypothetical protein
MGDSLHHLNQTWNVWGHFPQDSNWSAESYVPIYKLNTVESAIALMNTFPEESVKNNMFFMMKDGILPMWEDEKNIHGGSFSFKIPDKDIYRVWKELTYTIVGETISLNQQFVSNVNGITISPKRCFSIVKIWMCNCDFQNPQLITDAIQGLLIKGCLFKKHTV